MIPAPVVGLIGPLGPAQLACLRSWRRRGISTLFVHCGEEPLFAWARSIADHYVYGGKSGAPDSGLIASTAEALATRKAVGIACLSETLATALWRERAALPPAVVLLFNPPEVFRTLASKSEQMALARDAGMRVLPTWILHPGTEIDRLDLVFPLVLRPDRADTVAPSFKAKLIHDKAALGRFLGALESHSGPVVAQPFLACPNLVVHGYRNASDQSGGHCAFRADVKYSGVCVTLCPIDIPSGLDASCDSFERSLGVRGVFHYDFLWDGPDRAPIFLEMNGRLGGTTGKTFAAGYDEPAALLQAFGVVTPAGAAPLVPKRMRCAVSRLAALRCLAATLRGRGSLLDFPYPDRRALLRSLMPAIATWSDEVMQLRDPHATLAFLSQGLR